MKTILLNLPNENRVMRRYVCSFNAPNFLFPPQELLYLGSILKEWKKTDVKLIDSIAEHLEIDDVIKIIEEYKPEIIVSMTGFECFSADILLLDKIKGMFPNIKTIIFGHIPTIYPKETLDNSKIDYIILNEPELTFSELYDLIKENKSVNHLEGLALRNDLKIIINKPRERIRKIDDLPFPDYSLINIHNYNEPFFGKPYATIQTSRGCPFNCNYCVKTYGHLTSFHSVNRVVDEIEILIKKYGVKYIRFIDDTFTMNKKRVIETCKLIIKKKLNFNWSCLTRVDGIDEEMARHMKNAGCKRIFIGIESGSQKVLDYLNKGYNINDSKDKINRIRVVGIELVGYFIVGSPIEDESDFNESVKLANELKFDYVLISKFLCYPGTQLFNQFKKEIDFSLFPYKIEFKNKELERIYLRREKEFYRRFYLRLGYLFKGIKNIFRYPLESLNSFKELVGYIVVRNKKKRVDLI